MPAYDAELIEAVAAQWHELLEIAFPDGGVGQKGRVVLQFVLHSDGRVTDLAVVETSVEPRLSLLCQQAVLDRAPFKPWSEQMLREYGGDHRSVQYTFYYD
jgi:hypothetical protein